MARNDQFLDDQLRAWPSEKDRDDYEAWHEYLLLCQAEKEKAGLTSQNIRPAQLRNTDTTITLPLTRTEFQAAEDCSQPSSQLPQQPCSPAASDQTSLPVDDQASAQ